jgi:transcription elongation factor GreA
MGQVILTKQGLKKIKEELEHVKSVKIPYADNRLKDAKEYGDPAVIRDAKAEREFYNQRIVVLKGMIETAKIV